MRDSKVSVLGAIWWFLLYYEHFITKYGQRHVDTQKITAICDCGNA